MKKHVFIVCILTISCLLLSGCVNEESPITQRLNLSCESAEDSYIHIPAEELNGNFDPGISYFGIRNLTIDMDGTALPLESAIYDGLITVEEIWAFAMIDAKNGFCTEEGNSHNGLSYFVYHYPDVCDLYFSHDVYETPSGKTYITMHFNVYAYQEADNIYYIPTEYDEYGNPYSADREDWKLTVKINNVSSTGFDIQIYQPHLLTKDRSQHIGELHLTRFSLHYLGADVPEEAEDILYQTFIIPEGNTRIQQDTVNTFFVNSTTIEGFPSSLPAGSYQIKLTVTDIFDEEKVHPLMLDYTDQQFYWLRFDIP